MLTDDNIRSGWLLNRGVHEMGIAGFPWVPWDFNGNSNGIVDRNGNRNECDENGISIFAMAFPFPSFYFQFSAVMHVRKT